MLYFETIPLEMCRTRKEKKSEKEQFVDSAIHKKLRNKRKRDPDMRVEALLECTVRRLYSETLEFQSCYCPSPKRQKTTQDFENKTKSKEILSNKITGYMGNVRGYLEKKVTSNFEDSTTNNKLRTPVSQPAINAQNNVRTMKPYDKSLSSTNKKLEKEEDIDFETLFQSIVEIGRASCRERV